MNNKKILTKKKFYFFKILFFLHSLFCFSIFIFFEYIGKGPILKGIILMILFTFLIPDFKGVLLFYRKYEKENKNGIYFFTDYQLEKKYLYFFLTFGYFFKLAWNIIKGKKLNEANLEKKDGET